MRSAFFLFLFSALVSQDLHAQAAGIGRAGGTGNQLFPVNPQTSTYQTIPSDFQFCKTIPVASGTFTITLVASATQPKNGGCIRIINYGSGVVTVAPSGQTINGSSSNRVIAAGTPLNPQGLWIASDGTNYQAQPLGAAPAGTFSCQILDNSICTSAVDAPGNPNFLATAAGVVLPINGGTTPLVMFIGGVYQVLNSNVTLTVPSTASVQQWILAKQDTTNASMVAADFLAMNTAPFYQYTAPTCPSPGTALSATNPSFWYDLSTNLSKLCTTNAGSYTASASMVIGTIFVDATPKVLQVLTEPYRLNPYNRFMQFGSGADGVLTITSGTTTIDVHKQYQSVLMTAGTLNHTTVANNLSTIGISFYSQNPVMLIGTAAVNATGLGRIAAGGGTGVGSSGIASGSGGSAGGGGGSGTVSAAGGSGGSRVGWVNTAAAVNGGLPGTSAPTAGGNGTATPAEPPQVLFLLGCYGAGGGAGAGDATNAGGSGGNGGGSVFMRAPSILAISTAAITANGNVGSIGVAGNAGGGGGGGGGCVDVNGGYLNVSAATITANGGTGGAKAGAGTGTAGGTGGAGLVQLNKLW